MLRVQFLHEKDQNFSQQLLSELGLLFVGLDNPKGNSEEDDQQFDSSPNLPPSIGLDNVFRIHRHRSILIQHQSIGIGIVLHPHTHFSHFICYLFNGSESTTQKEK